MARAGSRPDSGCMSAGDDVTVFAIDDHPQLLRAVELVVDACDGFRSVGMADDPVVAIDLLAGHDGPTPDLILVDLHMPQRSGIETAHALVAAGTEAVIVLMSTADLDDLPPGALAPPIRGFLPKSELSIESLRNTWAEVVGAEPTH